MRLLNELRVRFYVYFLIFFFRKNFFINFTDFFVNDQTLTFFLFSNNIFILTVRFTVLQIILPYVQETYAYRIRWIFVFSYISYGHFSAKLVIVLVILVQNWVLQCKTIENFVIFFSEFQNNYGNIYNRFLAAFYPKHEFFSGYFKQTKNIEIIVLSSVLL